MSLKKAQQGVASVCVRGHHLGFSPLCGGSGEGTGARVRQAVVTGTQRQALWSHTEGQRPACLCRVSRTEEGLGEKGTEIVELSESSGLS